MASVTMMIAYTVTASTTDPAEAQRFLAWMAGDAEAGQPGHAADVVAGGALSAHVVRIDPSEAGEPIRVECRYVFESAEAFAAYEAGPAVALREEGRALFPADGPLALSRSLGEIVVEASSS
ncbi:MAG: DUF4286 domain-containing protein [Planctomycetota bacterium]